MIAGEAQGGFRHLGRDPAGEAGGVEPGDGCRRHPPRGQGVVENLPPQAEGGDAADAGHRNGPAVGRSTGVRRSIGRIAGR